MNNFRLREERARFERQEREALEKKLAPIKETRAAALAANTREMRHYWSRPINVIGKNVRDRIFISDMGVAFETTDAPVPGAGREEFGQFLERLTARTGYCLNSVGQHRLMLFAVSQCLAQNADLSKTSTWERCFDRLVELDVFNIELGLDESLITEQPAPAPQEPEPTVDDLEAMNLMFSREDERKAKKIVSEAVFGPKGQAAEVYNGFIRHVAIQFGHQMSESEQRALVATMERRNLSFLGGGGAYDLARCELVSNGILPRTCLTPEEILSQEIEETPTHEQSDYAQRQHLKRQIAAARNRN